MGDSHLFWKLRVGLYADTRRPNIWEEISQQASYLGKYDTNGKRRGPSHGVISQKEKKKVVQYYYLKIGTISQPRVEADTK